MVTAGTVAVQTQFKEEAIYMSRLTNSLAQWSVPLVGLAALSMPIEAQVFDLTPADGPAIISDQVSDTNKVKILRMPDGTLISVFGQAQDVDQDVYDLKARGIRARSITREIRTNPRCSMPATTSSSPSTPPTARPMPRSGPTKNSASRPIFRCRASRSRMPACGLHAFSGTPAPSRCERWARKGSFT